ncbi:MAG: DUF1552 domain-containing protein [Pirellulaceae bacterium]
MSNKSWHIDRRTCLKGAGMALALPLLEGMLHAGAKSPAELPRRMCCLFFPFGVAMPGDNSEDRPWGWFPQGEGRDYQLTNPLKPLEALRDQFTVLGGLSHPKGRSLGGHDTGDTFLTGSDLAGAQFTNTISLDQYAARYLGDKTRYASLTLSSDGGVGEPTRSTTLSFSADGRPLPALSSPRQIFGRLFGKEEEAAEAGRRRLTNTSSMLDEVLENSRSLKSRLGKQDQQKLDDYLASVRALEQRVEQSQKWLDIPKPDVAPDAVDLAADPQAPKEYLRAMYDLLFLAFQTDSTRLATYMIGQVAGATTIANAFPACIGLSGNWHGLAHGAGKKGGAEKLGRFDQFLAENLAYFLKRMADTREGDGSLLDRTLVFYGSSNSKTHQNRNYPLLLAGGRALGVRHGQYLRFDEKTPLANLFVTLLDRLNVPVDAFADSTGEMSELL